METVAIIIPAKNEVETIGEVLYKLNELTLPVIPNCKIYVVDGNSTDETSHKAIIYGAKIIMGKGLGKGLDVQKALEILNADYVYMLDADGTYPEKYIEFMHHVLTHSQYDVVIGSRLDGIIQKGAMSLRNRFGNTMLTLLANILYRTKTPDLCTGMWGFNRKALNLMKLTANGFDIEANLFTEIDRNKLKLKSIPIVYKSRGVTKPKLKMSDGFVIAKRLITERFK